ncbi:hypothetical protein F9L33_09950 [Amylibacter sp. SFDW26]|uniref:NYN domain-containing protein n=1 Tax=Amylibacter sp. SFDW26 TaxID=2652722 RepID=UPI0012624352|nr:hypothetical protein [Amylibacter sp. SFDW26]KAB7613689.1 hypothetical protein F9L33_09950 [Amylibacter sp. SFDW26]
MNATMKHKPITLGEKLTAIKPKKPSFGSGGWLRKTLHIVINFSLLIAIFILPLWWFLVRPDIDQNFILIILVVLITQWLFFVRRVNHHNALKQTKRTKSTFANIHFLLANDHQDFIANLRLDAKTVILDGSNIYHFGHDNGLDAQPLGMIANQLRTEGYRIVCFFDANIFFTLSKHGAFPSDVQHSLKMLEDIFGLQPNEIYVVPAGEQADKYVLSSLKHLPISFAVSNDRFRDYSKQYPTVMKDNQWRKGVVISKNEIKLLQHRFKTPVRLN